jgi:RNA polymerase sigma factor (sigma-70 family)
MQTSIRPEDWSRYALALRRLAAELVGPEQRDDLVQSTFAAALERPPRVLSWNWLAAVLRNRARDLARSRARHGRPAALAELASGASDASEIAQRLELQEELTRELRALAEPYQSTLYLRYFEELTPAEIARRGAVPVKTVKTRLERGLALLRERLERRHGPGARAYLLLLGPVPDGAPAIPPLTAGLTAGGMALMWKKIAGVAGLLLALLFVWRTTRPAERAPEGTAPAAEVVAAATEPEEPPALTSPHETAFREESAATTAVERLPPVTGSLRVLVRWSDGTAAPGVAVDLRGLRPGTSHADRGLTRVTSDEEGVAVARELAPGTVAVRTGRGARAEAEIIAGEEREVVLALADALEVEGRVLDERDAPVAGAEIWLTSEWTDWLGMAPVARSDADGRFHLRDVPATQSLGATAAGFAPSKLADLELVDTSAAPAAVVLRVTDEGGALHGRVLDAHGDPVGSAFVCAGMRIRGHVLRPDGTSGEVWSPRLAACDEDGRFRFEGLPPGVLPVEVTAPSAPLWSSTAEVRAGATTELTVTLPAGAALGGIVRDAHGAPVARAFVRAFATSVPPTFMAHGQYDDPSVIGSPVTLTDTEGRYRLENVWAGEVHAYASPPRGADDWHSEFHAEAVLHPLAGETLEWNPVLEPGRTIRGRVFFSDREPMVEVHVSAREAESSVRRSLTTDDAGRFEFFNLPAGPFRVEVQIFTPGAAPLFAEGVFPDGPELELVADFSSEPAELPGRVRGRFVDPTQRFARPLGATLAMVGGFRYPERSDGGEFEFTDVPPGRYRVVGSCGDEVGFAGEEFELAPGEELDVGTLEVGAGVNLLVRLRRAPGLEHEQVRAYLRMSGTSGKALDFSRSDEVELRNLTRGSYVITLQGAGRGAQVLRELVLAGDDEIELPLLPAAARQVEVAFSEATSRGTLHVLVTGADGATYEDTTYVRAWNRLSPKALGLALPVGRYTVRVETSAGFAASGELSVESAGESAEPLRLELR